MLLDDVAGVNLRYTEFAGLVSCGIGQIFFLELTNATPKLFQNFRNSAPIVTVSRVQLSRVIQLGPIASHRLDSDSLTND